MPSTNKTEKLRLNCWTENDRPTRVDFINDNIIIDNMLGTHLESGTLHLSAEEKARVQSPYSFRIIQGTGEETRNISFDFEPKMVIMIAAGKDAFEISNGEIKLNQCIAVNGYGSSKKCLLSGSTFTFYQKTEGAVIYNFNNIENQYVVAAFR